MDANNGVFPVAICICAGEKKESWARFIDQLYKHIGMEDSKRITFMNDHQKGVLDDVGRYSPRSTTSNKATFLEEMVNLKEVNPKAYD
ncbi:hypothetical protein EZV62_005146 [Acer yangbiense]|uniref:MULE transposase domain-containing protein n=1 Tax=Acer yangbiense TaxID=1000413 RepID=A0A5C7ILX5_9ROSI|nr:hypothetical protein EZV62_005146 [Acer yangbiense]